MELTVRQLQDHLAPFRKRSLFSAFSHIVILWAGYAAGFAAALVVQQTVAQVAIGLLTGIFVGSLFMIGHDACHGSYTDRRWLNQVLGRFVFLPSYHTYSLWELSHNRIHHIKTNLRGKDFVWLPRSKAEYDALSPLRKLIYRIQRTPLGLTIYYPLDIWIPRLVFPRRRYLDQPRPLYTLDRLLVGAFFVLQIVVLILVGRSLHHGVVDWIVGTLASLVLPWLVFDWMIGFVIYFNHTHPDVPWFANADEWSFYDGTIYGTVRVKFPDWSMVIASNIMDHVAHHLDPRIPLVNLRAAQDRLDELCAGQIVVEQWSIRGTFDIMRRCKLYDYEAHQWTDYEGRPTSAVNWVGVADLQPG
jgi:omega-6 fatty acid desaturase (delta-12 desaturase)